MFRSEYHFCCRTAGVCDRIYTEEVSFINGNSGESDKNRYQVMKHFHTVLDSFAGGTIYSFHMYNYTQKLVDQSIKSNGGLLANQSIQIRYCHLK